MLVLDHGSVHRRLDKVDSAGGFPVTRRDGGGGRPAATAARAAKPRLRRGSTFAAELDRLLAGGMIDRPSHDHDRKSLLDARRSLRRVSGTRRTELGAVLANVEQIAAAGRLTASRLPGLVAAIERNREWWTTGPLLSDGERVGFPGSELIWQYYPGQGIEIQWLGSFGKANAYFLGGRTHDTNLTALLDEAVRLAVARAGGIAWEYEFRFDGGAPGWVSGLAQGTGIQALGRAAVRFGRGPYFGAARAALGIFNTPPPEGVRVATPSGAHYLIYSFAPTERVLNGFIQSLVGLYDYAGLGNDDSARALFAAGEAEARLEVPRYDTGAWSLYDPSLESDLSYHTLLRDFLDHLCERLQPPAPASGAPAPAPVAAPTPATAAQVPTAGEVPGPTGGTPPAGPPPVPAPGPAPLPPPGPAPAPPAPAPGRPGDVYCATAAHFTAYLHQPPALSLAPVGHPDAGGSATVRLTLSKVSSVTLTVRRAGHPVYRLSERLGHGVRMLGWNPRHAGTYAVSAVATDLAGNAGSATATVSVAPAPAHARHPAARRPRPRGAGAASHMAGAPSGAHPLGRTLGGTPSGAQAGRQAGGSPRAGGPDPIGL